MIHSATVVPQTPQHTVSSASRAGCYDVQHQFEFDVHIFDTDCYGVMWHGAYVKWLELGRVDLFKALGLFLKDLSDQHHIVCPVVEQRLKFKSPAKFGDRVCLSTQVMLSGFKFTFFQQLINTQTERVIIEVETEVVMINEAGRMHRQIPQPVLDQLSQFAIKEG